MFFGLHHMQAQQNPISTVCFSFRSHLKFFGSSFRHKSSRQEKFSSLSQTLLANRHGYLIHSQIYANCFSFSQINYASACDPLYLQKLFGSMDYLYRVMKQKFFSHNVCNGICNRYRQEAEMNDGQHRSGNKQVPKHQTCNILCCTVLRLTKSQGAANSPSRCTKLHDRIKTEAYEIKSYKWKVLWCLVRSILQIAIGGAVPHAEFRLPALDF